MIILNKDFFGFFENLKKRDISDNTLKAYTADINCFSDYITKLNKPDLTKVTNGDILEFLHTSRESGMSVSKLNRILSAIKTFYKYLFESRIISENPTSNLHTFKLETSMPKCLNEYQIETLLQEPSSITPKGTRDRAMLELMYATALRVSELITLKTSDIDLEIGCIKCTGPNGAERTIPIYNYAKECIKCYLDKRPQFPNSDQTDILFLNLEGKPLSRQGVWKMVKYYGKKCGIRTEITPQTIRHSIAVHMLINGYDIKSLKEIMGHSCIAYTKMYEKMTENYINEEYKLYHPRAKYKQK